MAVKCAKKLTISGLEYEVISAHPNFGLQTEEINCTTLSDDRVKKCPRHQVEETDLELLVAWSGSLPSVGSVASLSISVTDSEGNSVASGNISGFVKSAIPQEIAVDGERRLVQRIVFTPNGTNGGES